MHTFRDLIAWQKSHALTLDIYRITKEFPRDEIFGLTNQIRRASVSLVSNIAEGFGRRTMADRAHFYDMARASLHEVQAQLLVAKDVGYILQDRHQSLDDASIECHKLLTGLINKTNGTK
ncbi:four helix bundle protein [Candidatus Saccharibacteria bacterium]|nr:MAG: four helix bundle protein [Candidatus Saccharibacteria bacterium]